MSDPEQLEKKVSINALAFLVIQAMVFKRKKGKKAKKKAEEEAQIGFEGGAWDQAQQPQPGFSPDEPPLEGPPAMPQPGSEGQNALIYICPHCQDKFSTDRPFQSLLVACPKCNGQSVIDPIF